MRGLHLGNQKDKKRAAYFWSVLLAIPVLLLIWGLRPEEGFIRWLYPVFILMCLRWAWRLSNKEKLHQIEKEVIFVTSTLFIVKLYFYLFSGNLEQNWVEVESTYWVIAFLMVIIYIAFDTRRGLLFSLMLVAITLILGTLRLWGVFTSGQNQDEFLAFVRNEMRLSAMAGLLYVLAIAKDQLVDAHQQVQQMHSLARTDPLTGLPNRLALSEFLESESQQMHGLYVVLLDVDHFKQINDKYGHAVGDEVLKEISRRLRYSLRKGDVLGRWGGEELMILMRGQNQHDILAAVERLREDIAFWPFEQAGAVSASFGIAEGHMGDSIHSLLDRADKSLYQAKHLGRNRVEFSLA